MNVLMPQLGETVTEGTIAKWYKSVGDTIAAGDVLFEIETDKTSMEVPALAGGILAEIRAQKGQTVPVNAVVCIITADGKVSIETAPGEIATATAAPAKSAPAAAPAPQPVAAPPAVKRDIDPFNSVQSPPKNFGKATLPSGAKITPLARRLAAEAGVDLGTLQGSGPHGRIVAADIKRAQPAQAAAVPAAATGNAYREIPLDGMRRTIAKRLVESKQTVPHFYLSTDVSVEALLALRQQINTLTPKRISVNDFIVKAYALALQKVPAANAIWAEDKLLQYERSDIGVAVAIEGGLITPVVRSADLKSLATISAEISDLAKRARERKLKPAEYQGGTGTVSNLGMYGIRQFSAIVNPPQATILAVGAAERRPEEATDGSVRFASKLTVTLSVDHRVVDGAVAGELLAAFRTIVEAPLSLLL
ncbi:MAG: pyruvate dehydrogenase complex dihydrolipoamide acetyltransferase [Steroidobacteraceae bacterium]